MHAITSLSESLLPRPSCLCLSSVEQSAVSATNILSLHTIDGIFSYHPPSIHRLRFPACYLFFLFLFLFLFLLFCLFLFFSFFPSFFSSFRPSRPFVLLVLLPVELTSSIYFAALYTYAAFKVSECRLIFPSCCSLLVAHCSLLIAHCSLLCAPGAMYGDTDN